MEKIINCRLTFFLESTQNLPAHQFGFRKMHSTIDALNKFTSDIINSIKNKQHVICVSFDMRKAYDTTWRFGITQTLHKIGLKGNLPMFINNFLTNRSFQTKIGSTISRRHYLDQGVPQGGVLSCTLFSLAINNIFPIIPTNINSSLYVDDLLIYCSGTHVADLERRLQLAINKIGSWAESSGFTFSAPKTNCIHFHGLRNTQPPLKLLLNKQIIPNRESIKYLGMTLDFRLNWKLHIKSLKLDCMKRLDLLKCLSHTTWGADRTTLLRVYRAIIRSKIDYGSSLYCTATEKVLGELDPGHNADLRLCTGAYRSSPVVSLYAESGEPPLKTRRTQLLLQYYARTQQLPSSAMASYIEPPPTNDRTARLTLAEIIKEKIEENEITISTMPFIYKKTPLWQLPEGVLCDSWEYPKKGGCSDSAMCDYFYDHRHAHHHDHLCIYTDGAKNEQGVGSAAASLGGSKSLRMMPETSIYTAELTGILCGL